MLPNWVTALEAKAHFMLLYEERKKKIPRVYLLRKTNSCVVFIHQMDVPSKLLVEHPKLRVDIGIYCKAS